MYYVFTNNRRSLQKVPVRAALQTKQKKKKEGESSQKRLEVFMCLYSLVNVLCIHK